jgi:hypothetical protein
LIARVADGVNTRFSTVLMVFRLTPTRAASSAWVQPLASLASRSRFSSASANPVRLSFARREAEQRRADAKRHDDVNGFVQADGVED